MEKLTSTPVIKGASMHELITRMKTVMDTENVTQLEMTKVLDAFRHEMNDVAKNITTTGKRIETEQKALSGIKEGLMVLTIVSVIVTLPTLPLSLGSGALPEGLVGGVLSLSQGVQGFTTIVSGGGQIAQGGVQLENSYQMSKAATLREIPSSLHSLMDSMNKGLDSTSNASRKLAEAAGQLIELEQRAQIITNNKI